MRERFKKKHQKINSQNEKNFLKKIDDQKENFSQNKELENNKAEKN